jgi:hypothetical protein
LGGGIDQHGWFDLQNGVVSGTPANLISQSIRALSGGWYLCKMVFAQSGTTDDVFIAHTDTNTDSQHTGIVGKGIYYWFAQLVPGAY